MVDVFSRTEFEQVLDAIAPGGWNCDGLTDGEYAYDLPAGGLAVRVRSSVRPDGVSAAAGEDSIRVYVLDAGGGPWGSKAARWVTRAPGWERRLAALVARLLGLVRAAGACPGCGERCRPFKVRKGGPNRGRFLKCCNARCRRPLFEWLDWASGARGETPGVW